MVFFIAIVVVGGRLFWVVDGRRLRPGSGAPTSAWRFFDGGTQSSDILY